jgi:hypothetical protein
MWKTQLITLYCTVCRYYDSTICAEVQRLSNNNRPQFTDQEMMTVYLWGIQQRLFDTKAIHRYTLRHLRDWFPRLPSYQAFNRRLGELCTAFSALSECLLRDQKQDAYALTPLMVDSLQALAKLGRADMPMSLGKYVPRPAILRKEWY